MTERVVGFSFCHLWTIKIFTKLRQKKNRPRKRKTIGGWFAKGQVNHVASSAPLHRYRHSLTPRPAPCILCYNADVTGVLLIKYQCSWCQYLSTRISIWAKERWSEYLEVNDHWIADHSFGLLAARKFHTWLKVTSEFKGSIHDLTQLINTGLNQHPLVWGYQRKYTKTKL